MFGLHKSPKSSTKLDPIPLDCFTPGILTEGCGTGRAYVVYLAKDSEIGLITFNHCAAHSCVPEKDSDLAVGFVHDLYHSSEWRALSPGRGVNLCLSAPNVITWHDLHHFKIPFGRSSVSIFATDFSISKVDALDHAGALTHCVEDLKRHQAGLDAIFREFEDAAGGF